ASLASFHRRHRTVRFDVQILGSLQQAAALRDARLDAAFLRSPASEPSLDSMVLMSEPLLAALPARHRLAARERVAISDLGAELFILPPRTAVPILHDLVLKLCRDAGFVPNVAHEIDHPSMVLGLVGAGIGVSLVPASARRLRPRGVVLKRLRPSPRVLQTALAWRRDPASPLVSSFVEAVRPQWPGR
ncbi:MAG TPA: LysR family substrate-binding domain-containing protein, partial [Vicinamibacteria bacterium]|nr:LysR family substrate-binding domain-containing protein [Vicinamibacteria bacterium]